MSPVFTEMPHPRFPRNSDVCHMKQAKTALHLLFLEEENILFYDRMSSPVKKRYFVFTFILTPPFA